MRLYIDSCIFGLLVYNFVDSWGFGDNWGLGYRIKFEIDSFLLYIEWMLNLLYEGFLVRLLELYMN